MTVSVRTLPDGRKEIRCKCDHNGCGKTATRKTVRYHYDRETGRMRTSVSKPRMPFFYWQKVFAGGRNPFYLFATDVHYFPDGVSAYCAEHR